MQNKQPRWVHRMTVALHENTTATFNQFTISCLLKRYWLKLQQYVMWWSSNGY